MKNVLIVGAGRLGKGFVGETFDNAGWNLTFLDKDPRVTEELRKDGCYYVKVYKTVRSKILKHILVMKNTHAWRLSWRRM